MFFEANAQKDEKALDSLMKYDLEEVVITATRSEKS
jgi:hypothetical protein